MGGKRGQGMGGKKKKWSQEGKRGKTQQSAVRKNWEARKAEKKGGGGYDDWLEKYVQKKRPRTR